MRDEGVAPDGRPAAVLIALMDRDTGISVLLTRRADHLHDHPGQVSFPGGRIDQGDASSIDAALREAEEEVGLPRSGVQVLGTLPAYRTVTGYHITPVVAWVRAEMDLCADPFEVAEIFEVPLEFLMVADNYRRQFWVHDGVVGEGWAVTYRDYFIWGATAGMLHRLMVCLGSEGGGA